jgi:hypothetical protein
MRTRKREIARAGTYGAGGNPKAVTAKDLKEIEDIEEHDILADAAGSGYYPDVSIGARRRAEDGKMYLHHLAYLGQEPPAIENLIAEIKEPLGIAAADGAYAEGLVFFRR